MKFKKIMSVLASAIMLSSTIGFAAAASYPAPFVSGGTANSAIIVGANAAITDMNAAILVKDDLNKLVTATGTGTSTASGGDSVKLEKSTNLFDLGNNVTDFYSTLDYEELSTVLAKGTYSNDANDEFDYEQSISPGANLQLTHFHESDFNDDKPVIGFNLVDGTFVFNYTLEFTPKAAEAGGAWIASNDLETTDLTMLGRTYYVLSARNTTATNQALTLLDTANSATITEGEPATITVGDKSYIVSIDSIASSYVVLNVDGKNTNKLDEGGVYKIATDTYLAVKSNLYNTKDTGISKVEISIGSGKILLQNAEEVQLNGEDISGIDYTQEGSAEVVNGEVTSFIKTTGANIDSITLEWKLDSNAWLMAGGDLTLPGFETIKLSYGGFNSPKSEKTKIEANSDKSVQLITELPEGAVTIDILALNATQGGFNFIGKDSEHQLVTTNPLSTTSITIDLNESNTNMFPVTWVSGDDFESYLFEIGGIDKTDGKNATTLDNLATGGSDVVLTKVGDDYDKGNVKLTLDAASDTGKNCTITLTRASGTGAIYTDRLVSKEGLMMKLPWSNNSLAGVYDGALNITGALNPATWTMNFTEEDKDGAIGVGKSFSVTITGNVDDGGEPSATSISTHETEDDSDKWIGYKVSDLATEVLHDNPSTGLDKMEITYHGEESYADVFIAESGVVITPGGGTGGVQVLIVEDTDVESVKDMNLFVVGGSCINSVAAKILVSETPLCGQAWTDKTQAGPGKYIIKTIASPYASATSGKIAMLVAGYEAADTTSAVAKAMEAPGASSVIGTSQVYPIVGTI